MRLQTGSIWAILPLLLLTQSAHTLQASQSDLLCSKTATDVKDLTTRSALAARSDSEFEDGDSSSESSDSDYKPAAKHAMGSKRRVSTRLLGTEASRKKRGIAKTTRRTRPTSRKTPETVSSDTPSEPSTWDFTLPEGHDKLQTLAEVASSMKPLSLSSPEENSGATSVDGKPAAAEDRSFCRFPGCTNKSGFSRNGALTKHYKERHSQLPNPELKCLKCGRQCWEIESLQGHPCRIVQQQRNYPDPKLIHLDDTQRRGKGFAEYVCGECEKRFTTMYGYGSHWLALHSSPGEETVFRCTITPGCPFKTKWRGNFLRHENSKQCGKKIERMRKKLSKQQKRKQKKSIA